MGILTVNHLAVSMRPTNLQSGRIVKSVLSVGFFTHALHVGGNATHAVKTQTPEIPDIVVFLIAIPLTTGGLWGWIIQLDHFIAPRTNMASGNVGKTLNM